ncbi:hypothetical protein N7517_011164 [Penicillium concentricum]|uniref:Uncharacterized protein n=1 Tax=Penicillium concentricum TaxID=293559 RepID=A0A9W9RA89_9EURO|nr:uncharacterized protein N7517_011164 [Penicillium concentricum]KAJ5356555.1 hypothetical protein N7517_011164 [Penicillium concentricum]
MEYSTQPEAASQRALGLGDILRMIFSRNTRSDEEAMAYHSDLLRWALVNSRWYREAIPLLWARPRFPLHVIMAKVPSERRQYYANHVAWALVVYHTQYQKDAYAENGLLYGLVFPKLTRIFASLYAPNSYTARKRFSFSVIYFERRVGELEGVPSLDEIFWPITNLMPGLREMAFKYEMVLIEDTAFSYLKGQARIARNDQPTAPENIHWFYRDDSGEPHNWEQGRSNGAWMARRLRMFASDTFDMMSNQQQV